MSWLGGLIKPKIKGCRGGIVLVLALALAALQVLGIGCGLRNPNLAAGREFVQGVRWAPEAPSSTLRTIYYYKLMGQPALALKELEEAHRLDPANLKIANLLAQTCDELGMGRRAQQVYKEALAQDPNNPTLLNNLGFSYYLAGDYEQAETCLRQALDCQPQNQAAKNNLALVLCRQNRQEAARALWLAEGEAVVAQKMAATLAALGMTPAPRPESVAPVASVAPKPAAAPVTPSAPPAPAPTVTAAAPAPAAATPPAARPEKIAYAAHAALTYPRREAASKPQPKVEAAPPRKISAPPPAAPKVAQAPSPPPAAPVQVASRPPARPSQPPSAPAAPPPVIARKPAPPAPPGADRRAPAPTRATREAFLTFSELVGTNIAIFNGNGVHDLARETRSLLWGEGFNVVAIANYLDFGVQRTIIYYRPDAAHVAKQLNKRFFPGALIKPAPDLAHNVDIKVILGHDWLPDQYPEAVG